jgi:hypothetical protein
MFEFKHQCWFDKFLDSNEFQMNFRSLGFKWKWIYINPLEIAKGHCSIGPLLAAQLEEQGSSLPMAAPAAAHRILANGGELRRGKRL